MLRGALVGLRAIERSDLPLLLEYRNRPELRQYFREYRELGMADQERWFEHKVLNDPATRMFSIVELATDRLLGACGLCYIDAVNRSADFSLYIGADGLYVDDRYAPETARLLIDYGFDELNLHRIWTEIYDFDVRKTAFFQALGFTLEGRHRQTKWRQSKWSDSLFWGLLSSDPRPGQR